MITMLFGPPGSGKGTQAVALARLFAVPHIATGDIFRKNLKEGTALGILARSFMDKGQLVPDQVTCDMVADRLTQPDCADGVLFDGFPRTVSQAEWLLNWLSGRPARVFSLTVPDSFLLERITGRRVCTKCGVPYHIVYNPPPDACTQCGGADIVHRADDQEAVVRDRLVVYARDTAPVLGVLSSLPVYPIDGVGSVEDIRSRILGAIASAG